MGLRPVLKQVLAASLLVLLSSGCKSGAQQNSGMNQPDDKNIVVYVSSNAPLIKQKAESYGLKVENIGEKSAAGHVIQALLNAPSNKYFIVINPITNHYIGGGALTDETNPDQVDAMLRHFKEMNKAGVTQYSRLQPIDSHHVKVTVFSDYQCPFCKMMNDQVDQVQKEFGNKVDFQMLNFPLERIHPNAFNSAVAAECARDQNHYDPFREALFADQARLTRPHFIRLAQSMNMNVDAFRQCMESLPVKDKIHQDMTFGEYMGVNGTPAVFINGYAVNVHNPEHFKDMINAALEGKDPTQVVAHDTPPPPPPPASAEPATH